MNSTWLLAIYSSTRIKWFIRTKNRFLFEKNFEFDFLFLSDIKTFDCSDKEFLLDRINNSKRTNFYFWLIILIVLLILSIGTEWKRNSSTNKAIKTKEKKSFRWFFSSAMILPIVLLINNIVLFFFETIGYQLCHSGKKKRKSWD